MTETAIIRNEWSKAQQARLTTRVYEVFANADRVRSVFFHRLLYPPGNTHLDDVWQTYAIDAEGHYTNVWRALMRARR